MKLYSETYQRLYATTQVINGHKTVQADPAGIWGTAYGYVPFDQLPNGDVTPADEPAPSLDSQDAEPEEAAEWSSRFSPEAYLRRWPDGPSADLARQIVEG